MIRVPERVEGLHFSVSRKERTVLRQAQDKRERVGRFSF
jgi:hypothetical protein